MLGPVPPTEPQKTPRAQPWKLRTPLLVLLASAAVVLGLVLGFSRHAADPRTPPAPTRALSDVARIDTRVVAAGCVSADAGACKQTAQGGSAAFHAPGLVGANVRVLRERGGDYFPMLEGRTDGGGSWGASLPAGVYYWLVEAAGRARMSRRVEIDGAARELRFALESAVPLGVTVRDERNRPIAGATVLVYGKDELPHAAVTSAAGSATFAHAGAELETVHVHASGFESVAFEPTTRDLEVTLKLPAELAISVALPGGESAVGAEVWLAGAFVWPPRRAETDDRGVALLGGLREGSYDVRARSGDLVSATLVGVQVVAGARTPAKLQLEPGRLVTVRVTDSAAQPSAVPGADVVLAEDGLSPFPLQGRSNAQGLATLGPLVSRPATLSVRAEGFMAENGIAVPPSMSGELHVGLVRGGRLGGVIVDAEGTPVEGARLEIVGNDWRGRPIARHSGSASVVRGFFERSLAAPLPLVPMGELGVMPGPLPTPGMPGLAPAPSEAWASDGEGQFRIQDVPPGRVRVLVRHPDFVESMSSAVTLEPGGEQQLRVVLARGGALEGRVVDEHGRPVEGARVEAVAAHGTQQKSALSAADGSFAFGGLAPEVDLLLARPTERHRFVALERLKLTPGETRELELTLPAERVALSARILDQDERPLEGARVSILSLDPKVPLRRTAYADPAGEVELADSAGIRARLQVQAGGHRPFEVELDSVPERLDVTLESGITVAGRVTHVRGRQPLARAEVVLLAAGERRRTHTDEYGEYGFSDLGPGQVHLMISHPEFAARTLDAGVRPTGRADRVFELPEVDLEPAGAISGVVLDATGQPVSGARVGLGFVPAFLPAGTQPSSLRQSDAQGRFELLGVPVGRATVSAYAAGAGRGSREVEVTAGDVTRDVEIHLAGAPSDAELPALANVAVTLGERGALEALEVVIVDVAPSSEAERAGVQRGDVLLAIDGEPARNMSEARRRLGGRDGSDVVLELERAGGGLSLRVRREPVRR